jgi:NADPH:quinone reductase
MRAILATSIGGPEHLVLVHDRPTPESRAGHAVVAVAAAGLNFPDILTLQGTYQHKQEPPYVPGMEGAGVVQSVGPDGDPHWIGRSVMFSVRGSLAERVSVPFADLADVPAGWSLEAAAGFAVVAKTAYHALVHRAALKAGETLLVHGAAGGTGHLAVKLGKALGARVIATGRNPARLAMVKAMGADVVIDSQGADLADRIKAVAPRGIDVTFDPVGGAVFDASLKASAFGGRIAVVGFTSGEPNTVRTNYALIKGLSILGVRAGEAARHSPHVAEDYAKHLPRLAATSDIQPHVGAMFAMPDTADAFRCLATSAVPGKVVIRL